MPFSTRLCFLVLAFTCVVAAGPVQAAVLDTPTLTLVRTSRTSVTVDVTAGPSGAPAGFWIDWTSRADYDAGGWTGYTVYCTFNGTPTLNVDNASNYILGPNETARIEVGDFFDETGMWASYTGDMDPGTEYVFRIFAMQSGTETASPYSGDLFFSTQFESPQNCTYTQGYWKNHTSAWPVTSLTIGGVSYTAAELLAIFNKSAQGNGLIFLAHQLIAARLNEANGATVPPALAAAMASADALIGGLVVPPIGAGFIAPNLASSLTETLDQYNNGTLGPGHCDAVPVEVTSWGAIKSNKIEP